MIIVESKKCLLVMIENLETEDLRLRELERGGFVVSKVNLIIVIGRETMLLVYCCCCG